MCAGALQWSQLSKLVFAQEDVHRGYREINPAMIHPKTEVNFGLHAAASKKLLETFFDKLRTEK
jgi:tRNA(adenine34) deaminase